MGGIFRKLSEGVKLGEMPCINHREPLFGSASHELAAGLGYNVGSPYLINPIP